MARIDTLANFITDVATAIKSKTGKTDPITPANFDTEINDISGSEDLTEELNTYNTELTEQDSLIDTVINTLQTKTIAEDLTEELNTYNTELTEQDTKLANIINTLQIKTTSEDLTEELSMYDAALSEQEIKIANAIELLQTKAAGGGNSKYAPSFVSFCWYGGTDLSDEIAALDTSNITSMASMFRECQNITSLDLSSFDTSKVTEMNHMFCNTQNLETLDVSSFDTSNVTTLYFCFYNLTKLTRLDLSSWYTPNVTNMDYLVCACYDLTYLDIRNFDFTNVTTYSKSTFSGVPNDCEIIVKDDDARTWIKNVNANFTNIKTVAELEG